jgi:fructokinase
LGFANVFKLNNDEVPVVAELLGLPTDEKAFVLSVAQRFDLHTVALTRGAAGSLVWHKGQYDEKTAPKVAVVDTVGAGDSFTAALAIGLLRGEDLSRLHQRAVDVAAFVCTKAGATPELLPEFKR